MRPAPPPGDLIHLPAVATDIAFLMGAVTFSTTLGMRTVLAVLVAQLVIRQFRVVGNVGYDAAIVVAAG